MTMKQELLVLEILDVGGVPTPNLKVVLRAMDICQRQGLGQHFAGTKKIVYVKPLQLVRMLLPAYSHVLLVDNDLEKSKGVGPASRRGWVNAPQEHMEVPAFRGEMWTTACTRMGVHPGWSSFTASTSSAPCCRWWTAAGVGAAAAACTTPINHQFYPP